jgi:hypothetical protein
MNGKRILTKLQEGDEMHVMDNGKILFWTSSFAEEFLRNAGSV